MDVIPLFVPFAAFPALLDAHATLALAAALGAFFLHDTLARDVAAPDALRLVALLQRLGVLLALIAVVRAVRLSLRVGRRLVVGCMRIALPLAIGITGSLAHDRRREAGPDDRAQFGASFGRGFFVPDEGSPLRGVTEESRAREPTA